MLLPLSRFFRPSAPILGDKTNRKSSYYMCWGNRGKVITQSWNLLSGFTSPSLKGYHHPGRSHPPSRTLPGEGGSVPACPVPNNLSFPPQSNTIFLADKKQPVINCQYTTGGTTCQKQSWMLTLRTDTRQMQGSRSPVAGLALILHTKVNFFFQRTQFSWTSSLWERKKKKFKYRYKAKSRSANKWRSSATPWFTWNCTTQRC